MAFYDKFPYTNFQELNLDRLIQELMIVKNKLDFVIENASLKYADPIQWNITHQYQANTVVIDPETGIAYISTKPVPDNILITDTGYWTPIFDLSTFFDDTEQAIEALQQAVDTVNGDLTAEVTNRENADNALSGRIDSANDSITQEVTNRTDADTALSNRISAIERGVFVTPEMFGAVGDGVTDDTQAIIDALNSSISNVVVFQRTYYTTSSIAVPNNKHLVGMGGISGGYFTNTFPTGTFDLSSSFNVFFSGLTFQTAQHMKTQKTYCFYGRGASTQTCGGINIDTCWMIEGNATPNDVTFLHLEGEYAIVHLYNVLLDAGLSSGGAIELYGGDNAHSYVNDINMTNVFFDTLYSPGCANLIVKDINAVDLMNCTFRVNTTTYNLQMLHTNTVTFVNAMNCSFIDESTPDLYPSAQYNGTIDINTGTVFTDRGCIYANINLDNKSIIRKYVNNRLVEAIAPNSGQLVTYNNPTISAPETDGCFSLTRTATTNFVPVSVGFVWNLASNYTFRPIASTGSDRSQSMCGVGFTSTGSNVVRFIYPGYDANGNECYYYDEMANNGATTSHLQTINQSHLTDPLYVVEVNRSAVTATVKITSDMIHFIDLITNVSIANYDQVGVIAASKSGTVQAKIEVIMHSED